MAMTTPYRRHQKIIDMEISGKVRPLLIDIEPIQNGFPGSPYWLILLTDQSVDIQLQQAKTWTKMAQKVAHDIKNPLSAILLSLQQLQLKYKKRIPEASVEFDPYVSRIIGRIDSLRQMTRNFMKFVRISVSAFLRILNWNLNRGKTRRPYKLIRIKYNPWSKTWWPMRLTPCRKVAELPFQRSWHKDCN